MPRIAVPGEPTEKQRAAWEAVERLGAQIAAAHELGIHQGSLQSRLRGYQRAMGIVDALPGLTDGHQAHRAMTPRGAGRVSQLRGQLYEAQAEARDLRKRVARLEARIADLEERAAPFAEVHRKLAAIERAILARPAVPVITHRRQADGGVGGKMERRRVA